MQKLIDALQRTLQHTPNELQFGTSGLRGLVTDMTDLECYINVQGFMAFLEESGAYGPHEKSDQAAFQTAEQKAGQGAPRKEYQRQRGGVVYLAGDLRDSTPRIMRAVHRALTDAGYQTEYCGLIPTPAVAYYALQQRVPCIMVTGSHIPADRNGIKFYKPDGEVLKGDEPAIRRAVAVIRERCYSQPADSSIFDADGMLRRDVALPGALSGSRMDTEQPDINVDANTSKDLPDEQPDAREMYIERYTSVFGNRLAGLKLVFYQHSAVGRDLLVDILRRLGAEVVPVGRSDTFVPIDSENVKAADKAYFKKLAAEYPDAFAIVSTDGDSDRPFVIDAAGTFHRGDVLGAVAADWLQADFAAFPISSSDAVTTYLAAHGVPYTATRIGSPYVLSAMQEALADGKRRAVGWEVNGGFMLGTDIDIADEGRVLRALPTRDALLPIIVALLAARDKGRSQEAEDWLTGQSHRWPQEEDSRKALPQQGVSQKGGSLAEVFAVLPARSTQASLIDNFPVADSQAILERLSEDTSAVRQELEQYFTAGDGFGEIVGINTMDGVRITFANGDIAHIRPSNNAPQLRIYSVAGSQERADAITALAVKEPDGIFRRLQSGL